MPGRKRPNPQRLDVENEAKRQELSFFQFVPREKPASLPPPQIPGQLPASSGTDHALQPISDLENNGGVELPQNTGKNSAKIVSNRCVSLIFKFWRAMKILISFFSLYSSFRYTAQTNKTQEKEGQAKDTEGSSPSQAQATSTPASTRHCRLTNINSCSQRWPLQS